LAGFHHLKHTKKEKGEEGKIKNQGEEDEEEEEENQEKEDPEEEENTMKRRPAIMGFLIEQLGTRNSAKRQCGLSQCDDTKIGNRHRRFALKRFVDY
jgi:hypothetical protein